MKEPKEVKLYNTASREIEVLKPLQPGKVALYCCGPTVYNYPHIGNMRAYIFEDILARSIRRAGYELTHAMNITDVGHLVSDADQGEDKMAVAAKREGKKSEDIANYYTEVFFRHSALLGIVRPDIVCKATEHISEMIALVQQLEEKGFAYLSGGNVYFDVAKFERYGDLAQLDVEQLRAGARIEVDGNKRSPMDFALWFTKSKFDNQELQWDSPWGRGYPGWHIECSAMAMHYLGESIDIHCGGIDHIPVHHTNEIAQSEAATGQRFASIWMHGAFLVMSNSKMSKSRGNFLTIDSIVERGIDPLAYRLFCMSASYRRELAWSWEALENAASRLTRLKRAVVEIRSGFDGDIQGLEAEPDDPLLSKFDDACFDDLGIPKALALLHSLLDDESVDNDRKLALLLNFDEIFGLGIADWKAEEIPVEIKELADLRVQARARRDWGEADELRDKITAAGYSVEDSGDGYTLKSV